VKGAIDHVGDHLSRPDTERGGHEIREGDARLRRPR
jgi:hypothetical protein